ncbi:tetratricopeptide repeat protein [Oceanimonas sp. NS1]|uniref:tetratricopeptide repeat protein n=1 Tax=Oceanimonas sp. MB9 TaxID=2588453 RepID=UPI0013F6746C|nr:tetratricopeptide repeat protein [Oceanimonas sp. MB9]MCT7656288.1 tetratricopeptide repeat protein [Oceanimonas sp. NS1]NHI01876.1 Photosystem I assembly protein Ycf3 [Oceanimonas sp. MB9]
MKHTALALVIILLSGCSAMSDSDGNGLPAIKTPGAGAIKPTNGKEARMLIAQSQTSGDLDAMIYAYIQALAFNEFDKVDLYINIARLEHQRNNNARAELAYRNALREDAKRLDAKEGLALLLIDMKRHREAETLLLEVVKADQARLGQASTDVDECVTNAESPWRSYNGLGLLADILEQGQQARKHYRCALQIQPGMAMLHTNLGFSHYLNSDYPQAEQAYTRAVNQEPEYERAWSNLGLLYYRWGRQSEALMALRKIMSQAEALNDLGYIAMMEGEYDIASSLFQRAIDASPRYYPKAVDNLSQAKSMQAVSKR